MPEGGAPRRIRVLLAVAAAVLAADVISKVIVVATLPGHQPIRLPGGVLTLQVLRNSGAAFSIGTSMTVVFTLIAAGVIVFILRTARMLRSLPWAVTFGLLLGGATGNLVDRLARAPGPLRGDVVDWIQLPHWPVFNLADSAIVCGGALAILLSIRGIRIDGTRDGTREAAGAPGKVLAGGAARRGEHRSGAEPRADPAPRGAELRPSRNALGDAAGAPGKAGIAGSGSDRGAKWGRALGDAAAEQPLAAGQASPGPGEKSAGSGVQGNTHDRMRAPESGVDDSGVRQP